MKNNEPLSDHPLFRALVLMGGGLALGCGGVARTDPDPNPLATAGSAGSSGAPAEAGGSGPIVITDPAPPISKGGSPSTDSGVPKLPCPTEQYDCVINEQSYCGLDISSQLAAGACKCDPSRPTSAKDCKPNENFVCYQGYLADTITSTWDGSTHVQCSCIPSPIPATYQNCLPACVAAFPGLSADWSSCILPNACVYDGAGNCTATSADVLYQDGIMCGCANLGLK